MSELLFEKKKRHDLKPASGNYNIFDYYDNNAQPKIKSIRKILNSWFQSYPKNERKSLKDNFKNDFNAAFFELFIHELLIRQNFKVSIHPKIDGTSKSPDFLVEKNGAEFYIEAIQTDGRSELDVKRDNFRNAIINELNKIKTPYFWLYLRDINFKSTNSPKISSARKIISNKISRIDIEEANLKLKLYGIKGLDNYKYEDDNISVEFGLIAKSESAQADEDERAIGIEILPSGSWSQEELSEPFIKAFKKKSSRYGLLNKPYLIFINYTGWISDLTDDVNFAFYGNQFNKGIFTKMPSSSSRVSGVFVTNINEANLNSVNHRLLQNPNAKNVLDFNIFTLSKNYLVNDKIVFESNKSIGSILDLGEYY